MLSTGLNAGTDAANAVDEDHETRVPRPVVPWVEHDIVRGWQSVANALHHFAMDCDCCPLVCHGGHTNNSGITYHMECCYCNRIHCPWKCSVFIHFDQSHTGYIHTHTKHTHTVPHSACATRRGGPAGVLQAVHSVSAQQCGIGKHAQQCI